MSFGTHKYGDLGATFAAIYLDSNARDVMLDADITSGVLREPILKVLALMRSMDYVSNSPVIIMEGLKVDIGQMAHSFDSVFSFFLPEFKPYGRIGNANLVSPEATLLDMPKIIGLINGLNSMVNYGMSSCGDGWGPQRCYEQKYIKSTEGRLEFNTTFPDKEFSFETFEGPSLVGGLDNSWIGRYFRSHNGKATPDPLGNGNHVLHFPAADYNGNFFSPPVQNRDNDGNPYVVKFSFLSTGTPYGGCIGYVDATSTPAYDRTWALCDQYDINGYTMRSNGEWISCQFVVPPELESFRIVVGDRRSPGGDAYFDDIQLASGNETTCVGISVPKIDPPGQLGYSNEVVDRLSILLTAGRLGDTTKAIITKAFDDAGSAEDGLRMAQELILTTAEYHTTSIGKTKTQLRDNVSFPAPTGKPYRAILYIMLNGGCDSFNMLAPYTCSNGLYESYLGKCPHQWFPILFMVYH